MSTVIQKATKSYAAALASESVTSEDCVAWDGDHGVLHVGLGDRSDVDVVAIDVG